jgi:hypothetical protein
MFDDVKYLERILELVKKRKICLSSMSYDEDLGLNYMKDAEGNYLPVKGLSDVSVNMTFTGREDTVMNILNSWRDDAQSNKTP